MQTYELVITLDVGEFEPQEVLEAIKEDIGRAVSREVAKMEGREVEYLEIETKEESDVFYGWSS